MATGNMLNEIVLLCIGFLMVVILTPMGMDQIIGANQTLWETPVKTIFNVLFPLLYMVGCAVYFVPKATGKS